MGFAFPYMEVDMHTTTPCGTRYAHIRHISFFLAIGYFHVKFTLFLLYFMRTLNRENGRLETGRFTLCWTKRGLKSLGQYNARQCTWCTVQHRTVYEQVYYSDHFSLTIQKCFPAAAQSNKTTITKLSLEHRALSKQVSKLSRGKDVVHSIN